MLQSNFMHSRITDAIPEENTNSNFDTSDQNRSAQGSQYQALTNTLSQN